jgi:hypothetical protein
MSSRSTKTFRISSKTRVTIEDLGITLYPGAPVEVDERAVKSSGCLRALFSMKKVEIIQESPMNPRVPVQINDSSLANKKVEKYRRAELAPQVTAGKAQEPKPIWKEAEPQPQTVTKSEAEEMARLAAKAAAEEATRIVMNALGSMISSIEGKIDSTVSGLAVASRPQTQTSTHKNEKVEELDGFEEPVFIPKGIIRGDSENLAVNKSSSESADVDDTISALKSLKRKK